MNFILKKMFCFRTYDQILKVFHTYFLKESHFYHVFKKNTKTRYHNRIMIIH
jgi:hypothetical protein